MSQTIFVTGTDTNVGKTVFCAGLTRLLDARYWKPIQAGLEGESDSETVRRLTGLPAERVLPEAWRLKTPASPHWSAELDGVSVDADELAPPLGPDRLVIEGAGGLMVPINRRALFIDLIARWRMPTVLCARTTLGTLNHTLLSLEALRARRIPVLGVAFIGDEHADNQRTIAEMGHVRVLGRLPMLATLSASCLAQAFSRAFEPRSFLEPVGA